MEKTMKYIFGDSASNLEAKFLPEVIELSYIDNKTKLKNTKYIDYESFFTAVNRQTKLETKLMAPGVRYMSRKDGLVYALVEDIGGIQELAYHAKKRNRRDSDDEEEIVTKIKVPVPPILLGVVLREREGIVSTRVWALKEPIRSLDDKIYEFPLGNSYGPDGKFCWGTATDYLHKIKEVSQLRSIFNLIYCSTFNDDLDAKYRPTQDMSSESDENLDDMQNLYNYLNDKEKFPYECLREVGTVRNCIKDLERRR